MGFDERYSQVVVQKTVDQLVADLARVGFTAANVVGEVEGEDLVFVLTRGGESRVWRYPLRDTVYAFVPDGTDPMQHALWLSTLIEEENTDLLHHE